MKSNSAEGGSNTTPVSTINSGGASGDAFDAVTGSGPTFSTDHPAHGSLGYKIPFASSVQQLLVWNNGGLQVVGRTYLYFPSLPSANATFGAVINTSATSIFTPIITATGQIAIHDQAASKFNSGANLAAINTQYRCEWAIQIATATTGSIWWQMYLGDNTSPVAGLSSAGTIAGCNCGTVSAQNTQLGAFAGTATWTAYLDDLAVDNGTLTPLGPYVPPAVQLARAPFVTSQAARRRSFNI